MQNMRNLRWLVLVFFLGIAVTIGISAIYNWFVTSPDEVTIYRGTGQFFTDSHVSQTLSYQDAQTVQVDYDGTRSLPIFYNYQGEGIGISKGDSYQWELIVFHHWGIPIYQVHLSTLPQSMYTIYPWNNIQGTTSYEGFWQHWQAITKSPIAGYWLAP